MRDNDDDRDHRDHDQFAADLDARLVAAVVAAKAAIAALPAADQIKAATDIAAVLLDGLDRLRTVAAQADRTRLDG